MVDPAVWLSIVAAKSVNKKKWGSQTIQTWVYEKNRLSIGQAKVVTSIIESIYLCEKLGTFIFTYTKACIKYIIQNLC